jgi:nicotinamidase-related amidase
MQNDIAGSHKSGHEVEYDISAITKNIAKLRDAFHSNNLPVIYTMVAYRPSYVDAHATAPARKQNTLKLGDKGAEIIGDLEPTGDDIVVVKRRIGAFYQTELELIMRGLGKSSLVVTGTSLPRAVESTVREAHSRDIWSLVVKDACFAASRDEHSHCIEVLSKYNFASVVTTVEVCKILEGAVV